MTYRKTQTETDKEAITQETKNNDKDVKMKQCPSVTGEDAAPVSHSKAETNTTSWRGHPRTSQACTKKTWGTKYAVYRIKPCDKAGKIPE